MTQKPLTQSDWKNLPEEKGPYELPEGWKWVRLGNIIDLNYGKGLSKEKRKGGEVPVYGSNGIIGYHNSAFIEFQTIIVGRKGSVGEVNLTGGPSWPIDTTFYVTLKIENINIYYLFYFLKVFKNRLIKSLGVKPGINRNNYLNNLIPLPFKDGKPDLSKQKQIVAKIEEIFSRVDKAIKLREEALNKTEKLFQMVLEEVFREAKEDKEGWKWVVLKEIIKDLESGKRPKGGAKNKGIPSLGGEHLNYNGTFNFERMKYIPEDFFKLMKKGIIKNKDILIVKDGATTGKVGYISEDFPFKYAAINEHLFIVRLKEFLFPKYIFWLLYSPSGQKEILKNFGGAAQGGINRKFVENVILPIPFRNNKPDLSKQKQIVERLDRLNEKIKKMEKLQKKELDKLKMIKEHVLYKAFRGQLI